MKSCVVLVLVFSLLQQSFVLGIDPIENVNVLGTIEDEETTWLRRSSSNSTSQLKKTRRNLQFGQSVVCNPTDTTVRDFWETTVIRNSRRNYYLDGRGAVPGSCIDSCKDVCKHKPCHNDFRIVNGDDCRCNFKAGLNCAANTFCNETADICVCNPGYEGSPQSAEGCSDINECSSLSPCGQNTICTNTLGSFGCECRQGFVGDPFGSGCFDVNECASNICGPNVATGGCTNVPGGYNCQCKPGYGWSAVYGTGCTNINECLQGVCGPGATCEDTVGSFKCKCRRGYRGNPPTTKCTDANECKERPGVCGPNASCQNTPGFFKCTCKAGYIGNPPLGADCKPTKCTASGIICGANAFCVEDTGLCTCPPGFSGPNVTNGGPCTEVDECLSNPCPPSTPVCVNLVGSFQCLTAEFGPCQTDAQCSVGKCAQLSRSDDSLVCCANSEPCSSGSLTNCCNGAYGVGEQCPSRNAKDCESPLKCGRVARGSSTYVCCRNTFTPILDPFPVCQ